MSGIILNHICSDFRKIYIFHFLNLRPQGSSFSSCKTDCVPVVTCADLLCLNSSLLLSTWDALNKGPHWVNSYLCPKKKKFGKGFGKALPDRIVFAFL